MRIVDTTTIHDWPEIAASFPRPPLLIGNGFSLRFTNQFRYVSLFEEFTGLLAPPDHDAFRALGSTDFELLLDRIAGAIAVNAAFGVPAPTVAAAQNTLRDGLIQTIQRVHPRYASLDTARLRRASETLDAFADVFTLNYDAILYHIIMLSKDRSRANVAVRPYNDYCWGGTNPDFLEFMGYQNYAHYDHVYYLHGALFLFHIGAGTFKIRRRDDADLLDRIGALIAGGMSPLFVSEGTSDAKGVAIARSPYLRFASDKLRLAGPRLVIYGASLSIQDSHIVEAIRNRSVPDRDEPVAVSVRINGKDDEVLRASIARYRNILRPRPVWFFDADTLFI